MSGSSLSSMRRLSPLRTTSVARDLDALVADQLAHFRIDASSEFGEALGDVVRHLYAV